MSSSNPVGIHIEGMHLSFGNHQVLKGIDLDIRPGELFAFLGPSGSGKSTFVTHDQEEANTIADRMAVLDQGVIQQVGTPLELYDNPTASNNGYFL